jgi:hypothetical protein
MSEAINIQLVEHNVWPELQPAGPDPVNLNNRNKRIQYYFASSILWFIGAIAFFILYKFEPYHTNPYNIVECNILNNTITSCGINTHCVTIQTFVLFDNITSIYNSNCNSIYCMGEILLTLIPNTTHICEYLSPNNIEVIDDTNNYLSASDMYFNKVMYIISIVSSVFVAVTFLGIGIYKKFQNTNYENLQNI